MHQDSYASSSGRGVVALVVAVLFSNMCRCTCHHLIPWDDVMPVVFRFERFNVSISAFFLGVSGSKLSSVHRVTESTSVWVVWVLCGFNMCGAIGPLSRIFSRCGQGGLGNLVVSSEHSF